MNKIYQYQHVGVWQPIEYLFGEFRQDLIDAQVAAFKQDYILVNQKIDSVLERMFSV